MARILNRIIAIGGTTAHQTPKSEAQVRADYITGANVLSSVVAVDNGRVIGWQSVGLHDGEGHIGTFVNPDIQARGVGAEMFALTLQTVRKTGTTRLIATIRADNVPGLRYYARMGFADSASEPDYALTDGRVVGRVHRRLDVV